MQTVTHSSEQTTGVKRRNDGVPVSTLLNPSTINATLIAAKALSRTKKVFIGGIATSTTEEDLRNYFSTFGDIDSCELMFDRNTNRSRGFAFITFTTESAAKRVCQKHFHTVNNKTVEVKKAVPREVISNTNTVLRQRQLTMQTLSAGRQIEVAAHVPNVTNYMDPGTSVATVAVPNVQASPGSALPMPNMLAMTINALQHKAQMNPRSSPFFSASFPPPIAALQNFNFLLPYNYQNDTTNMLACGQSTLPTATIAPCEYAAAMSTPYRTTNSTYVPLPLRLPSAYPATVGLPGSQQALISGTPQAYDPTGLGMATALQNPYPQSMQSNQAYNAVAAAVACNLYFSQEHHNPATVMAAASALRMAGVGISAGPLPPSLAAIAQPPSAALLNGTPVDSIESLQRIVIHQPPQLNGGTTAPIAHSQPMHGLDTIERASTSLSNDAVTDSSLAQLSSAPYAMPAKIPRTQ